MGLTLYYEWKAKADASAARRMVVKFRNLALKLPFDEVSEIYEQDPPDGEHRFEPYDHPFRKGDLYLGRKRADGTEEVVEVPAAHAVFFHARIEGAETVAVGLASHPPVVLHREDRIVRDKSGRERERHRGEGDPIEFPTRRRGCYSWQSFCKTQYAGHPDLGGEANFLRAHLSLIELLDQIAAGGLKVQVNDDTRYAKHRDVDRLLRKLREWDALIANFVGRLGDSMGDQGGEIVAPIKARPDFEHLEAKGIGVLKRLAKRQRNRKNRE